MLELGKEKGAAAPCFLYEKFEKMIFAKMLVVPTAKPKPHIWKRFQGNRNQNMYLGM